MMIDININEEWKNALSPEFDKPYFKTYGRRYLRNIKSMRFFHLRRIYSMHLIMRHLVKLSA
jgi:hypothetical protein